MPLSRTRRRVGRPRVRRHGKGFLDALKSAHNFIKSNKLVSGISGLLSNIPGPVGSIASAINKGSSALGYGRRRVYHLRRGVRRRGGALNIRSMLSGAHGFVKKHQLASKLLSHLGHPKLAGIASSAGYGRKRVVRSRRVGGAVVRRRAPVRRMVRHRGGANLSTEMIAAPRF